jgi:hypothetical protein
MRAASHPAHSAFEEVVRFGFVCMWLVAFWALLYFLFGPTLHGPLKDAPTHPDTFTVHPTLSGGAEYKYDYRPVCDYDKVPAPTYYQGSPNTEIPDPRSLMTPH